MRTKVFYNLPEDACYGCQACAEICPVSAISMKADKEGFLYPQIDSNICIECNLCEKSCPTQDKIISPLFYPVPTTGEAAWEKNLEARLQSTSGGMFFIISKLWQNNGGVIYGVDFNREMKVVHKRADNLKALERMRGSKYVQSDLKGIFKNIKEDLKNGLKVLFSGTPCQVAGLRSFLKKDYDNLLCIDLVCHGTPSPLIFKEHLSYLEKKFGKEIIDYKFRGKLKSGWRSYIKYFFADGKTKKNFWGEDFFAYSFYRARFNRRSCFTCAFSRAQRVGDITLSDFWNAEKYVKSLRIQRKYGFNLVMCNTVKGRKYFNETIPYINNLSLPMEIAINGDVRLRHTETAPNDRESIFEEYYNYGYDWLVQNRNVNLGLIKFIPTFFKNLIYELKARI